LRFQGQYEDAESGLYYNLNRYYDPLCGMYLSPDPIGLAGGLRPHSYVHNPTTYIDPLGLEDEPITWRGDTRPPELMLGAAVDYLLRWSIMVCIKYCKQLRNDCGSGKICHK